MRLRQEPEVVVVEPRWPKEDSREGSRVGSRVDSRGPWQTRRRMTCPELGILHLYTLHPLLEVTNI